MKNIHKNQILKTVVIIAIVVFSLSFFTNFGTAADSPLDMAAELENINVLTLVADDVGDNYLDVRDTLEGWNCTVDTVSNDVLVTTHGSLTSVDIDFVLDDFNLDTDLAPYDFLFIPSGAYWSRVCNLPDYTNFVKNVYEHESEILVGSMCVGSAILGAADIVEGKKILAQSNGAQLIVDAGGLYTYGYEILTDERIITGARGAGVNGHENAPYQEFSQTIVREVLGMSYLDNYTIEEVDEGSSNTHKISVYTQTHYNLDHLLTGVERNITEVEVMFYPSNSKKDTIEVGLVEIAENQFEGYISEDIGGKFKVKIEICNDLDELEIVTIGPQMRINSIPGFSVWILGTTFVIVVGVLSFITLRRLKR